MNNCVFYFFLHEKRIFLIIIFNNFLKVCKIVTHTLQLCVGVNLVIYNLRKKNGKYKQSLKQ